MSIIIWQLFLIGSLILMVYSLYRVVQSTYTLNQKILFLLMVLIFPFLGSVVFLMLDRKKENSKMEDE